MKVLLDTSAFIAMERVSDHHHEEALAKGKTLRETRSITFTSNAVLYETLTWFGTKAGPIAAREFGRGAWSASPSLRIIHLEREDELGALDIMLKYSQIPLSFVDASNIFLMRKHGMDRIFAFDRHFEAAGVAVL